MSGLEPRPPLPPFTRETAIQKVRLAEDGWNSRNPEKVALAYTPDSRWRNRVEFVNGREAMPTNGMTIRATGSAPSATRTGSSTRTA